MWHKTRSTKSTVTGALKGNAVKHFRSCIRQNAGLGAFPIRVLANAATQDSPNSLKKMLHSVA